MDRNVIWVRLYDWQVILRWNNASEYRIMTLKTQYIALLLICIFVWHIGPALGSALYSLGGFSLPYLSVGTFGLLVAISLYFVVPDVQANQNKYTSDCRKALNLRDISKVFIRMNLLTMNDVILFKFICKTC